MRQKTKTPVRLPDGGFDLLFYICGSSGMTEKSMRARECGYFLANAVMMRRQTMQLFSKLASGSMRMN